MWSGLTDMIIGLNFDESSSTEHKVDVLKGIISHIPSGNVKVYEASDLANYVKAVKSYDCRDKDTHLLLARTHQNESATMKPHDWRMHEYFFDFKGGTSWGVDPKRTGITYKGDMLDAAKIVSTALWAQNRASLVRTSSGATYLGSTTFEPTTLLIGYGMEYPSLSFPFKCLLGSLPDDWWTSVGMYRSVRFTPKPRAFFEYSNMVSLGDPSHEFLTSLGIEHGAVPKVPASAYTGAVRRYSPEYGTLMREVALTRADRRDWTEPGL